jgi:ribosomal protein S18 acetylase RimI-like enzyme
MIRVMTAEDIPFADSLRALAGWNQTLADWRRFLTCDRYGCFIAEVNGVPVGTATTIRYENRIAWVGMVLVHPDHRRQGIGRALLTHCIEYLRNHRVACIKLDATPLGQKLYETLGFQEEFTLTRWRGFVRDDVRRALDVPDLRRMVELDANAFGAERRQLILRLAADSENAYLEEQGFGMLRPGANALYLGPVVALSKKAAFRIFEALIRPGEIIIDIPDGNHAAASWAQSKGFLPERQLTRMRLGEEIIPAAPQTLYAIAAPEVG